MHTPSKTRSRALLEALFITTETLAITTQTELTNRRMNKEGSTVAESSRNYC